MPRSRASLLREGSSIQTAGTKPLISTLAVAILLAGCSGEEPQGARQEPTQPSNAEPVAAQGKENTVGNTAVPMPPTTAQPGCSVAAQEHHIGDFEAPEGTVPPYEVLEEEQVKQDCVEAVRLLVDTQARDKAGYTLIARDLKARHKDLDAISIEFTDTEGTFSYSGAALIFNTSAGAQFIGYSYGAPNDEGYYVSVADD